jgi:membrane protease YdiL (CAAX protease family)
VIFNATWRPNGDVGVRGVDSTLAVAWFPVLLFAACAKHLLRSITDTAAAGPTYELATALVAGILILAVVLIFAKSTRLFSDDIPKFQHSLPLRICAAIRNFVPTFIIVETFGYAWHVFLMNFNANDLRVQDVYKTLIETNSVLPTSLILIRVVIVTPIVEEIIFRGLMYKALKNSIGKFFGSATVALIFALLHWNVRAFLPMFVLSVCLARIYERDSDIAEPIIVHATFNGINAVLAKVLPHG